MRLNKKDLVDRMAERSGSSKNLCNKMLDVVLDEISSAVVAGDEVMLLGFGRFYSKQRKGKVGRNPKTGGAITIPAKRVCGFAVSKNLAEDIEANPIGEAS